MGSPINSHQWFKFSGNDSDFAKAKKRVVEFDPYDEGGIILSGGTRQPIGIVIDAKIISGNKMVLVGLLGAGGVMTVKAFITLVGDKVYSVLGGAVSNEAFMSPNNPHCIGISLGENLTLQTEKEIKVITQVL